GREALPTNAVLPGRSRIQCGYRETCSLAERPILGSVREVANPKGAATSRVCDRVEVPTAKCRKAFALPKGDRGPASRSREAIERGKSVRREAQTEPRRLVALQPAVGRWRHQRQG